MTARAAADPFEECARLASSHYENFPVASVLLPAEQRPYLQAVYAFSRVADDIADEGDDPPGERLARLDIWGEQLRACVSGEIRHPVFAALAETIRKNDIPLSLLEDLLSAFRQDVSTGRYPTYAALLDYCSRSANPVGRIVLMIFGHREPALMELSDAICTALQLTNFWQDVPIDWRKGRIYVPEEDMRKYGVTRADIAGSAATGAVRELLKYQVERTKDLFRRGEPLLRAVDRDLRLELRLIWFGGMTILRKIERRNYDVLSSRPLLNGFDKASIFGRGLFTRDPLKYGRTRDAWDLT